MDGFGPHTRSPAELAASRRLRGSGTPFLELRDDDGPPAPRRARRRAAVDRPRRRLRRGAPMGSGGLAAARGRGADRRRVDRGGRGLAQRDGGGRRARQRPAAAAGRRGDPRRAHAHPLPVHGPGGRLAHGGGRGDPGAGAHRRPAARAGGAVPPVAVGRLGRAGRQQGDRGRPRGLRGDGQDPHARAVRARSISPARASRTSAPSWPAAPWRPASCAAARPSAESRADRRRAGASAATPCDALPTPPTISVNPTEIFESGPMRLDRFTQKSRAAIQAAISLAAEPQARAGDADSTCSRRSCSADDSLVRRILKRIGASPEAVRGDVDAALAALPDALRPSPSRRPTPTSWPSCAPPSTRRARCRTSTSRRSTCCSRSPATTRPPARRCAPTARRRRRSPRSIAQVRGPHRATDENAEEQYEALREVRQRPHARRRGRPARPGDRPRRRDPPRHPGPLAPHEEQPRPDRRAGRRQDRDRRGPRAADRRPATCPSRCATAR